MRTEPATDARVLLFDIETTPLLSYTWGIWQQNVIEVAQDWKILSVAWKWLGEPGKPDVLTIEGEGDDYVLARLLYDLFDEADVVVAHNATKFDVPKSRTRMAWWGLEPPSPFQVVDTLRIARSQFAFTRNRLDDLCATLDLGRKMKHQGFDLWKKCMADDPSAWATMRRYNVHDVVLLEKLYRYLRPWAERGPNLAAISGRPKACPRCMSTAGMVARGWKQNQVTKRRRYQCRSCKGYSVGRELVKTDLRYLP